MEEPSFGDKSCMRVRRCGQDDDGWYSTMSDKRHGTSICMVGWQRATARDSRLFQLEGWYWYPHIGETFQLCYDGCTSPHRQIVIVFCDKETKGWVSSNSSGGIVTWVARLVGGHEGAAWTAPVSGGIKRSTNSAGELLV